MLKTCYVVWYGHGVWGPCRGGIIVYYKQKVVQYAATLHDVALLNRKEFCLWCVWLCLTIMTIHPAKEDDWWVMDELHTNSGNLVLENFLFFSLYLFSCITMQLMTLEYNLNTFDLFSNTHWQLEFLSDYILFLILPMWNPAHYIFTWLFPPFT